MGDISKLPILRQNQVQALNLESSETSLLPAFIPVFSPIVGADTQGVLPVGLTLLVVISGLLKAYKPFIVAVPAVQSLVLRGEALVTRSGADVLDLMQEVFLFL